MMTWDRLLTHVPTEDDAVGAVDWGGVSIDSNHVERYVNRLKLFRDAPAATSVELPTTVRRRHHRHGHPVLMIRQTGLSLKRRR